MPAVDCLRIGCRNRAGGQPTSAKRVARERGTAPHGRPPPSHGTRVSSRTSWPLVEQSGLGAKAQPYLDQQKKMEAVFEQSRPSFTDLGASVRKEETAMELLLAADQPDEGKILSQIDRVAQARAELEKANARMLLRLRRVLTPDQWKTLQADVPKGDPRGHYPRFGPMQAPGAGPGAVSGQNH